MHDWSLFRVLLSHPWLLAASVAAAAVTLSAMVGISNSSRRPCALRFGEEGGLSEELVLLLPIFVLFMALTIQMILLFNAKIVVNYAAFTAARSASVWVPVRIPPSPPTSITSDYNSEDPNTVRLSSQSPLKGIQLIATDETKLSKLDRVRSAAVLACAPISPSYLSWLAAYGRRAQLLGLPLPQELQSLTGPYQDTLRKVDALFAGEGGLAQGLRLIPRWYYSSLFTEVTFAGAQKANHITFTEDEDIEVIVEHKFYLNVPFVGRILGQKYRSLLENNSGGLLSSDIYYVPIQESYRIRNEGEPLYPGY